MDITDRCAFERVPVDKLTLDAKNPRIAKWLEMYGDNITAEDMSLALGAESGASEESREDSLQDGAQVAMKLLDVPVPDDAIEDAKLERLARDSVRRVLGLSYADLQRLRAA